MTAAPLTRFRTYPLRGLADLVAALQLVSWVGDVLVQVLRGIQVEPSALAPLGVLVSVALLSSVILLLVWVYRARCNLDAIQGTRPRWSPGWTVVAWLVPVANVVLIPMTWLDLIRNCAGEEEAGRMRLLLVGLYVVLAIDIVLWVFGSDLVSALLSGAATGFLLGLVFGVSDAQERLLG